MNSLEKRFMSKINRTNGCWIWTASRNAEGYGTFYLDGKKLLAHRFSYEYFMDEIPQGFEICHQCDNPSCVNPAHLFLGTHKDNMVDCSTKGRAGRHKGVAPLDTNTVEEIRWLRQTGWSCLEIANKFSISRQHVYFLCK